jgi:orotidine-5'-phosphate decarboxylase
MNPTPAEISEIEHPGDRLAARLAGVTPPICVGLDPVEERMPESLRHEAPIEAISSFCDGVLSAVQRIAPCVKIQSACFERFGAAGVALMDRVSRTAIDHGFEVILDAKRGDIGISAEHYAVSAHAMGVHWITLNGYLGEDGIRPFLDLGLGVFVLVRTSNPSGDEIQSARLKDGVMVAGRVGEMLARLGEEYAGEGSLSSVGAVVGATKPDDARELRALMPRQPFLLPGFGAQGGGAEGVAAALNTDGGGVLVTASRSVIYPDGPDEESWRDLIQDAGERFSLQIQEVVARKPS